MIIVLISMGVFALYTALYSHAYSKIKYNYGKDERNLYENGRKRNVRDGVWDTSTASGNGYSMSKLHEEKTDV